MKTVRGHFDASCHPRGLLSRNLFGRLRRFPHMRYVLGVQKVLPNFKLWVYHEICHPEEFSSGMAKIRGVFFFL